MDKWGSHVTHSWRPSREPHSLLLQHGTPMLCKKPGVQPGCSQPLQLPGVGEVTPRVTQRWLLCLQIVFLHMWMSVGRLSHKTKAKPGFVIVGESRYHPGQ